MFEKQKLELQVRSEPIQIQAFQTSIWDETLYAVSTKEYHVKKKTNTFNPGVGKDYSLLNSKYQCIAS